MKISRHLLADQQGVILFSSLTILSVLLAVGIGIRTMLQNDYKILANLRGGTEAFYVSAAGIEWSKSELGRTLTLPPAPANQTVSFQTGSFSISFMSPTSVGPLAASVVVRSTGSLGPSSHILQAQLTKTYDLADAAISLRGNAAAVNFGSSPILISGADYDPATDNAVPGAGPRSAISTSDDSLRDLVQQALGSAPQAVLDSPNISPGLTTSSRLPPTSVTQLVDDLCASAAAVVTIVPSSGALIFENQIWGTLSSPELRCFEGLAASGDAITIAGNTTGAGILIVRNADLVLAGSCRWEGLIIIAGGEIGLRVSGPSDKEMIGGVILNETGSPTSVKAILDIQGNIRLRFSRKTLARSAGLMSIATLEQAVPALPFVISQNYWRTVTP